MSSRKEMLNKYNFLSLSPTPTPPLPHPRQEPQPVMEQDGGGEVRPLVLGTLLFLSALHLGIQLRVCLNKEF